MAKDSLNLKDLILSWKDEYGSDYQSESGTYKVIPVQSDRRKELLGHLIKTLITNYEFKREDFTGSIRSQIVEACINSFTKKKVKKHEWREAVGSDYDVVLIGFFKIPIVQAEKSDWQTEGKAMPEALPPGIEKFADPENRQEVTKPKGSKIQDLDFSKVKRDVDAVRDIVDTDLLKELGLDDE